MEEKPKGLDSSHA